jgi:hypothetical protein
MRLTTFHRFCVLASSFLAALPAVAQYTARADAMGITVQESQSAQTFSEAIAPKNRWTLRIEPAAWYAGLGGKVGFPRGTTASPINKTKFSDINADNPILTPAGEARLRWNNWLFSLRGFAFERNPSGDVVDRTLSVPIGPYDRFTAKYQLTSVDLEVGYRVFDHRNEVLKRSEPSLRVDVDVIGGARLLDTSFELFGSSRTADIVPLDISSDETFIHPIVGARLELEVYERLGFDVQATGGYFPGNLESSSFDLIAGFWWEPINHVMVQLGYRALFFNYDSGDGRKDASADASLQGLYFGAVVRF